jgi:two-component system NarL family sensor kinase
MSLATSPRDILLLPLSVWLVGIAVAGRSTIRPLARLAVRAQLQRDLIVAATEAERARVAADIHDDALQELTLLVHRLDEAGDEEGADIARTVSDRLRAICGDLRLPILDDLGVGPALDWLVLRIERLSGGEVRLERSDGTRPPADVELAFFRVAQEALGNAVKHGQPPIVVRYRSTEVGASLSVDDAGPGILPDAAATAERDGRFGLLNMQQRAEAIGAILDVRRWPGGGTHVALEWRPH